jgi:hypothetical protein
MTSGTIDMPARVGVVAGDQTTKPSACAAAEIAKRLQELVETMRDTSSADSGAGLDLYA